MKFGDLVPTHFYGKTMDEAMKDHSGTTTLRLGQTDGTPRRASGHQHRRNISLDQYHMNMMAIIYVFIEIMTLIFVNFEQASHARDFITISDSDG